MKIALVIPPSRAIKASFIGYQQPINLAYLAASVMKNNVEIEIWDYGREEFPQESFIKKVNSFKPEIIGFHCKTFNIIQGNELGLLAKKYAPHITTIVGGPHSTALPTETLREFRGFDAVVIGEGETTLAELCRALSQGESIENIKGLALRKDSTILMTPPREIIQDLDTLPYPARQLFSDKVYNGLHATRGLTTKNRKTTEIFTSRGCPAKCIFCAVNLAFNNRVRFRSVNNILGEIEECLQKYHYDHIIIQDDTFTLKKDRVYELIKGIRRCSLKSWSCDARVDTVDKALIKEMVASGCKKISFGVESGSERILKLIKKGITIEQVKNAVAWAKEAGLEIVETTFIIGSHPDETYEDIKKTWALIRKLRPDILSVTSIVPYPGTEVYNLMKKEGYLINDRWENFQMFGTKLSWRTKYFSSEEIVQLQLKTINKYYLSVGYFIQRLKKIKNINDLSYWMKAGFDYLRFMTRSNGRQR